LRDIIIRLAVAAGCGLLLAAGAQAAADGDRAASPDLIKVRGLLTASGVPCTVGEVLKVAAPTAVARSAKRAKAAVPALPDRYEVSCQEGLGYIVTAAPDRDSRPSASFCFERNEQTPPAVCILPSNRGDAQRVAVAALLARARRTGCELDRYRFVGRSVANTFIEVSCRGADGYMISGSNPLDVAKKLEAVPCMGLADAASPSCRLSDRRTVVESMTAAAETMFVRESGRIHCKLHGRRYMMTDAAGNSYFEFMCQDGANYIMARLADGKFGGSDTCTAAVVADLGGCSLPKPAQ
jgi:hypothetical protein